MTLGKHAVPSLVVFAAMLAGLSVPAQAEWTIIVDPGRFAGIEVAAAAEEQVDWLDADRADDTACTQCFAAMELQRYLRRCTGRDADFALASKQPAAGDLILVGRPHAQAAEALVRKLGLGDEALAGLGPEGYRIKSAQAHGRQIVWIAGHERVGTLYGVYDLLYRLGCRWFAPGELHEDLPQIASLPDLDVTQRPSYASRGFLAWENRGSLDFLLWMARNRMDYWTLEQQPAGLMHKLGIRMVCGRHDAENEFLGPHNPYPYDHARFSGDESRARDPYPLSPEYQGDANGDGQLSYFEAHPEWYAMLKGKRIPGIKINFGRNYCTSNPHATAEFVKNYTQAVIDGRFRRADILRFWALDAGKWCECPACLAQGTPTDRYLLVVHRFCQELDQARTQGRLHRPLEVTFLAYADVVEPPTRALPQGFPPPYCMATFYPIRRCYVHRFDDPACAVNDKYNRQLAGWVRDPQRYYRGQLAIGEYYNVSRFKCLPICFMHSMATDVPYYYHQAGARTFDYMHVTTARWGSKALTNYQMARQLWDVQTDCETLWRDYFARRYGPAAGVMRHFYQTLEEMLCNATELKYGLAVRLEKGSPELFPNAQLRYRREPDQECHGPTFLEMLDHARRCRQLLSEVTALELRAEIKTRIAEDEQCFAYGERTLDYYHACVQAYTAIRAGQTAAAKTHYAEAQRLADLLRADTVSTSDSSSHANAENALLASGAAGALDRLAALLAAAK